MNACRTAAVVLALSFVSGCAGRVGFGEEGRLDDQYMQERRLCMTRPPAEVDACLRRLEQDYFIREGMRRRGEEDAAEDGLAPVEGATTPTEDARPQDAAGGESSAR
jgi:hypothetical protein